MPCLAQDYRPKLPATNHRKSLSSLIKETYAHCHVPCVRIPAAGWSSGEDSDDDSSLNDVLDTKQVILNEMRNRQMKKRSRCSVDSPTLSSTFVWSFTPPDPRSVLEKVSSPIKCVVEEKKEEEEEEAVDGIDCDADDESVAFFSVRSFFSRSTSRAATVASSDMDPPPPMRSPAMWEGFPDYEGWPFGLCHSPTVLPLPPLPSTPADSWKWRKRNSINLATRPDQSPSPAYSYKTFTSS